LKSFFRKRGRSTAISYKEKKNADCYKIVIKKTKERDSNIETTLRSNKIYTPSTGYLPEPHVLLDQCRMSCLISAKILGGAAEIP
jgi:hypothetical protein